MTHSGERPFICQVEGTYRYISNDIEVRTDIQVITKRYVLIYK